MLRRFRRRSRTERSMWPHRDDLWWLVRLRTAERGHEPVEPVVTDLGGFDGDEPPGACRDDDFLDVQEAADEPCGFQGFGEVLGADDGRVLAHAGLRGPDRRSLV